MYMKTMTCAQMGGMCDTAITAETKDEIKGKGMAHLEAMHPEMAESIKSMSNDDPMMVAWAEKFSTDWDATGECA